MEEKKRPRLYTVPEAAKELRMNKDNVYRLIREGHLHAIDVSGGRNGTRIPAEALDAFIAKGIPA